MSKLKLLKASHTSQIYRLESDIAKRYPMEITATKERVAGLKADLEAVKPYLDQDKDEFVITVARSCFQYAVDTKQDLWFSTKDTISKQYDHTFKDIFQEIYDSEYK